MNILMWDHYGSKKWYMTIDGIMTWTWQKP